MQIRLQKFVILSLFIVSPAYASSDSWKSDSTPVAFPSSFSSWTPSQYTSFQETFASLRDSTFDSWDESRLREWLLEQGIVAPTGPKEQIVLAAKRRWKDWQEAKEKYSTSASQAASAYMSDASATASQASSVVSSYAAQATTDVLPDRPFDSTKDYVWSTWDDTQLRKFLVENGVIDTRTAAGKKRDELIESAKTHYATASGHAWETWSDSYIVSRLLCPNVQHLYLFPFFLKRDWLAAHNLIDTRNSVQMSRDEYTALMKSYYYDSKHHVWDTWSDSDLRTWLIDNGYMKSDIVATRDKMLKNIQWLSIFFFHPRRFLIFFNVAEITSTMPNLHSLLPGPNPKCRLGSLKMAMCAATLRWRKTKWYRSLKKSECHTEANYLNTLLIFHPKISQHLIDSILIQFPLPCLARCPTTRLSPWIRCLRKQITYLTTQASTRSTHTLGTERFLSWTYARPTQGDFGW